MELVHHEYYDGRVKSTVCCEKDEGLFSAGIMLSGEYEFAEIDTKRWFNVIKSETVMDGKSYGVGDVCAVEAGSKVTMVVKEATIYVCYFGEHEAVKEYL